MQLLSVDAVFAALVVVATWAAGRLISLNRFFTEDKRWAAAALWVGLLYAACDFYVEYRTGATIREHVMQAVRRAPEDALASGQPDSPLVDPPPEPSAAPERVQTPSAPPPVERPTVTPQRSAAPDTDGASLLYASPNLPKKVCGQNWPLPEGEYFRAVRIVALATEYKAKRSNVEPADYHRLQPYVGTEAIRVDRSGCPENVASYVLYNVSKLLPP